MPSTLPEWAIHPVIPVDPDSDRPNRGYEAMEAWFEYYGRLAATFGEDQAWVIMKGHGTTMVDFCQLAMDLPGDREVPSVPHS